MGREEGERRGGGRRVWSLCILEHGQWGRATRVNVWREKEEEEISLEESDLYHNQSQQSDLVCEN